MEFQHDESQTAYAGLGSLLKVLLTCGTILTLFGCGIGFMLMTILADMLR